MAEKRWGKRFQTRIKADFGRESLAEAAGYVDDLAVSGFALRSATVHPVGTRLKIRFTTPDDKEIELTGEVRWAKQVPPSLAWSSATAGMGIKVVRFAAGELEYEALCYKLCEEQPRGAP